ncbi:HD domain-containing protein [Mesorhizobium sp. M7A.F.Ca.CA.001.08.2.1]|uniref:HD domain-containing protein n=1 Tax=Mesorhizobium sp. M7A.F.Ca.CA.001.08.2.1 TaxID=2496692 RepID=UPI000FC9E4DD|nr:HD domain-containing protein [Mesorhizobium sp. M7A.F.Ca.CA.001.08.2.1]
MNPKRMGDPLHDLIEFSETAFEQALWDAVNSEEMQRLRRIKQLGFSELVYPGATHTRLAHSLGVFHTARELSGRVRKFLGRDFDEDREKIALAAALVHDLGHGPFSHAFEDAMKKIAKARDQKVEKRHEIWTADIIRENTDIGRRIEKGMGKEAREAVATLLLQETPTDIYSGIVSSQFDADRLDYLRRDRLMTGVSHGSFDYFWLLANLEVDQVPFSTDGEDYANIDSLVLGNKAFQAAEAYVLGLFHMYFAVYFHKATRSAEKILTALLVRLGELILDGNVAATGLDSAHPITEFLVDSTLRNYLTLDDSVVWGSLPLMVRASDDHIKHLASRLLRRDLYKAFDVTEYFKGRGGEASVAKFRAALSEAKKADGFGYLEIFEDSPARDPYKRRGYDTPEALSKVLIRGSPGGPYQDLAELSDVVSALQKRTVYRVYAGNANALKKVKQIAMGVG